MKHIAGSGEIVRGQFTHSQICRGREGRRRERGGGEGGGRKRERERETRAHARAHTHTHTHTHTWGERDIYREGKRGEGGMEGGRERERERERHTHTHTHTQGWADTHAGPSGF